MQGAEIDGTLPPPQTELSGYAKIFHSYTYKGFRENISVRAHSDSLLHFTLAASPVNSTSSGQSSFARVQKHSAGRNGASSKNAKSSTKRAPPPPPMLFPAHQPSRLQSIWDYINQINLLDYRTASVLSYVCSANRSFETIPSALCIGSSVNAFFVSHHQVCRASETALGDHCPC